MSKLITIFGMLVAALLMLMFLLDLAIAIPFKRASLLMDICFLLAALMLAYLSWATLKEQT